MGSSSVNCETMKYELFMNNCAISPYKNTFLLAILLITIIASISPLNSYAGDINLIKRILCNKPTCKDELLQKLLNLKEDEYVAGYIINGSDIIEIIKESNIDIKIILLPFKIRFKLDLIRA